MSDVTSAFIVTLLTYLVSGSAPPIVVHYIMRIEFLGGIWTGVLVGVVAAVFGGLLATLVPSLPDVLVLANAVDVVPPLAASILITTLFALISKSNQTGN